MYRLLFFVGARVYWSSSVPNIVFWPFILMKMLKIDDAMMMTGALQARQCVRHNVQPRAPPTLY